MPGFISHTVMARDVYNEMDNKNVNLNYIVTYSLGGDLCKYAKCRYDSHHVNQDKFIYDMADYIKNNNLVKDKEIMGVLYGHICHYIMDSVIHPLVRKMDKTCVKNKKNHTLIEEYYDSYLVLERLEITKKDYIKKGLLKTKNNKKIDKMLDMVYMDVYHTKNVSKYYKFNLFLYRMLRNIYGIFSTKMIQGISGLNKFLVVNKDIDLFNDNRQIIYKNSIREEQNDSLISLYNECIMLAIQYINNVNKYLDI